MNAGGGRCALVDVEALSKFGLTRVSFDELPQFVVVECGLSFTKAQSVV